MDKILDELRAAQAVYDKRCLRAHQELADAQIERQEAALRAFDKMLVKGRRLETISQILGVKTGRVQQMLTAARLQRRWKETK
jgi:hypothetical protein